MNTKSSLQSKTLGRTSAVTVSRRNNSASGWLVAAGLLGMVSAAQGATMTVTSNGSGQIDWAQEKTLISFNRDIGGSTATTSPASGAWTTTDDFTFTGTGTIIDLQCTGVLGVTLLATDRTITSNSLTFDSNGFTISSSGSDIATLQTGSVSVTNAGDTATISAVISGSGSGAFTKSGLGTLVLSGTNTYSNGTTISAGTLQLGSGNLAGSLGSGDVSVANNAVLAMAGTATRALANNITGGGSVSQIGSGTSTLSGTNAYSGGTTVSAGTLIAGSISALGTGAVSVNGGTLQTTVSNVNTGALTLSSGSLSLNGTTAGSVTLASGANLLMSGGTWNLGLATNTDSIKGSGGATFSITGGTLDLGGGAINYGASYTLISGFNSGAVSGLNITNYNTALYTAVLGNNGVLSFTPVPEPSTYGLIGAGVLAAIALVRRRKKHAH